MRDDRVYLRHILDYLGLSLERVWGIVERDLPPLRAAVEAMLSELA